MLGGGRAEGVLRCARDATGKSGARPALPPQLSAASPRQQPLLRPWSEREGAAGDDPEPGDLRIALLDGFVRGGLNGTIPRAEEEPLLSPNAGIACSAGKLPRLTLVLGGARSGKSRYAERLVEAAASRGTYCATAEPRDDEMTARIAAHRARRGPFWRTVEAPLLLAEAVGAEARPDRPVLVDCLTLWLSNLMLADAPLPARFAMLQAALHEAAGPVVLVANEVGLGLVPETPLGRRFRDEAGWLNQDIAGLADRVVFVAAGLPLILKESPIPLSRNAGEGARGHGPRAGEGSFAVDPLTPALSPSGGEGKERGPW
jgi:adenosylcobinamide kinase / adenosylcobinamide-phosphate guanylyltransferase